MFCSSRLDTGVCDNGGDAHALMTTGSYDNNCMCLYKLMIYGVMFEGHAYAELSRNAELHKDEMLIVYVRWANNKLPVEY